MALEQCQYSVPSFLRFTLKAPHCFPNAELHTYAIIYDMFVNKRYLLRYLLACQTFLLLMTNYYTYLLLMSSFSEYFDEQIS